MGVTSTSLTDLVLVRHAQAEHNVAGRHALMSGWADLPLTACGTAQAERLARWLQHELRAAAVYTSPSERARHTALPIVRRLAVELRIESDLREIHCGDADGRSIAEVRERYPREWAANDAQQDPNFRWPGGESYREFRERVLGVVERIAAAHRGERVVLVTHTGVISQLMGHYAGLSPARWARFRPRNASITELRWSEQRLQVLGFDRLPDGCQAA